MPDQGLGAHLQIDVAMKSPLLDDQEMGKSKAIDDREESVPAWASQMIINQQEEREERFQCNIRFLGFIVLVFFTTTCTFLGLYINEIKKSSGNGVGTYTNLVCSEPCGQSCYGSGRPTCFDDCYENCLDSTAVRPGVLSPHLQLNVVQHIGVTVANMSRSLDFYVNVLGGVEVLNAGGDGWAGDDDSHGSVYQLLMQNEVLAGPPKSNYVADLKNGGTDSMDARYVNFGPLQIELLEYHPRSNMQNTSGLYHLKVETAPSVVGSVHFSFLLRDASALPAFVAELESVAHSRGMASVKCNTVREEASDTQRATDVQNDQQYNSYAVDSGSFNGWQLAYCKGPDNEQIEFNHAYAAAGEAFNQAQGKYVGGGTNKIWRRRGRRVM